MAFSFEVISLGMLPRIDTTQLNETMESAGAILGTYGSANSPLSTNVVNLAGQGFLIFQNTSYDVSNLLGYDTFRINGGAQQSFDGWATYNALVTYSDGSTATITAVVIQDVNGNTYLVPEQTNNTDQVALTAKPIMSLTLQSVVPTSGDLSADRIAGDFKAAVDGTAGNDDMNVGYADAQGDQITESNDDIIAGAGNDTISAGGGNDFVNAGDGIDFAEGGDGNDRLWGGAGNDTLSGSTGNDTIEGNIGDDDINAGSGGDVVYGGTGNDTIDDWDGDDLVYAGAGNDTAHVSVGNDTIYMEDGNDVVNIWDNAGQNTFFGGSGNDRLDFQNWQSATGAAVTFTGDGAGTFSHFAGATTGGFAEFEAVSGSAFADTLNAAATTIGVSLDGEAGNDVLTGGAGADVLLGGDGDDTLVGGAGADVLNGGTGRDTADYSASAAGVTVNLVAGTGSGGDAQGDTLTGVDNIIGTSNSDVLTLHNTSGIAYGGSGADTLFGGAGNNDWLYGGEDNDLIDGQAGNDSLFGGAGNDILIGGTGNDTLATGDGEDVIVITVNGGADRISDFNMTVVNGRTVDQIDVSALTTPGGGPIRSTDVVISDSNGNGTGDAILTFAGGESIILEGVTVADLATPAALLALGIPCFVSGTPILTPQGWQRVETLRRGNRVNTTEGEQRILWAGSRHLSVDDLVQRPDRKPVHFPIGSIGNTQPLRLSPQHAVLMRDIFGARVLVRAKHLAEIGHGGARVAQGVREVRYHHILLERHAVLCAAGAAVESFYPGTMAMEMLDWPARMAVAAAIAFKGPSQLPLSTGDLPRHYGDRVHPLMPWHSLRGPSSLGFDDACASNAMPIPPMVHV